LGGQNTKNYITCTHNLVQLKGIAIHLVIISFYAGK